MPSEPPYNRGLPEVPTTHTVKGLPTGGNGIPKKKDRRTEMKFCAYRLGLGCVNPSARGLVLPDRSAQSG